MATYRVSLHICDSVGAGGEEIDRAYSPNYYLMIHTAEGVSSPLLINSEISRDAYIGQQYRLFGLGRDIQYVTVIAMNKEPICIDSVTARYFIINYVLYYSYVVYYIHIPCI